MANSIEMLQRCGERQKGTAPAWACQVCFKVKPSERTDPLCYTCRTEQTLVALLLRAGHDQ